MEAPESAQARPTGARRLLLFSGPSDAPERPSLWAGLPFAVVAWVVLASEAATLSQAEVPWILAAVACLTAVSITFVVAYRRAQRSWLDSAAAYLFCAFVLFAREAGGGASSGVSALYLVPILWLALTGTRAEMLLSCLVVALCQMVPIMIVGEPHYPTGDWRRAFVIVALGLTIGSTAQWAVRMLRAENHRAKLANRRAERLFLDAPHGVALLDSAGVVLRSNRALNELLQVGTDGIRGTRLAHFETDENPRLGGLLGALAGDEERMQTGEATLVTTSGRTVHTVVSGRRFLDETMPGLVMLNVVDISERRNYEDRLAHLVAHDPVTGLASRRRFEQELAEHQRDCALHAPRGALLLIDLDHFKQVNDSLGHPAGDALLAKVGRLLNDSVRENDLVARLGGDEFAVLLPDAEVTVAEQVARRMVARVATMAAQLHGAARRVSASVGVVSFQAALDHAGDPLALADMTMYDAKEGGRGRVAVLPEGGGPGPALAERLLWQTRLEEALETDGFVLLLQPILDLGTNRVRSAEALLRLVDGDRLVRPGDFLPTAEAVGLVSRIDAWVLTHAVALLARIRVLDPDFHLEVNLSGLSMGAPTVEAAITLALAQHPAAAGGLVLEVTETAAIADVEGAREFADRMTQLGCAFAIDDFGAGFTSFRYLKSLHFDYVKIDGEFVEQAPTSAPDRAILHSIVELAHTMGKRTVAEYVANDEIMAVIRAEGVHLAQGNLIGLPQSYDDFAATFLTSQALS